MRDPLVIFDLDGTIALIDHRRHFVEGPEKDWNAFFDACHEDEGNIPIIFTVQAMRAFGFHLEIWSGRSDRVREKSQNWLGEYGLGDIPLRMRADGDHTPDDELKERWLLSSPVKPTLVFDDRDKVVAMWRRHSIVCAQVAPGNF